MPTCVPLSLQVHTGVKYSPIYVCKKCKMAFCTQGKLEHHATTCNLTESAYEQQQRLGLQEKPPPLRVKKPRQTKQTKHCNSSVGATPSKRNCTVPSDHFTSTFGVRASASLPTACPVQSAPVFSEPSPTLRDSGQQNAIQSVNGESPSAVGQFTPQFSLEMQQDLRVPQDFAPPSQFTQQFQAHQLYQFYTQ